MGFLGDIRGALGGIAAQVAERLTKAEQSEPGSKEPGKPAQEASALTLDPYWMLDQFGYRDKPSSVTYDTLKHLPIQIPILGAMLKTRIDQVSEFGVPQREHGIGFVVRPVEVGARLSAADRKFSRMLTQGFVRGSFADGWPGYEDSFSGFLKMVIADSLFLDQACFEVIPDRLGRPSSWMSVDGGSIRLADTMHLRQQPAWDLESVHTVQVFSGDVIGEYRRDRMAFGIRNPRTDMNLRGYGTAESELLMHTLTQLLHADQYNAKIFTGGVSVGGILGLKGNVSPQQFNEFRSDFYNRVSGIKNAHSLPIVRSADGLQFVNLHQNARDMAFPEYYDFLIKVCGAMIGMDPVEINFKYGNQGGGKSVFEEGNKDKLSASKARGLKPLLTFLGNLLTRMLVTPLDSDWNIEFVGLESATPTEKAELTKKRVSATLTFNEARREQGLDPIEGGDIIDSQVFLQRVQGLEAARQAPDQPSADEAGGEGGAEMAEKLLGAVGDKKDQNKTDEAGGGLKKSLAYSPVVIEVEL